MNDWPTALTIAVVVSGVSAVLLVLTICVICKRLHSRKPRREKKLLRDVKIDSLANLPDFGEESRDEHEPPVKYPGVYVNPPRSVPQVDPTPDVKIIKQPHQSGQPLVFRRDLDRWGTHNVVHVDGVNNVNVTPRTSWHQEHKVVHEDSQFKDYYYRIYPKGNEENLHEYDYIPIRVQSGALGPHLENLPQQNHVQSNPAGDQGQGPTVISFTDSNTSINGCYNNDQELLINPSRLSDNSDYVHRGVEMRNSKRQKRQAVLVNDNNSDHDSETHSVIENISAKPDGTTEHRVSLNVVFEEE